MHEHDYNLVIEWAWIVKASGQYVPIKDIKNSFGMKAVKVMCSCGEIKDLSLQL